MIEKINGIYLKRNDKIRVYDVNGNKVKNFHFFSKNLLTFFYKVV